MNKHKINKVVIFLLVLLISFSLSSCKKEESKENKSVVSTLLKNEYSGENSLIEIPFSQSNEIALKNEKEVSDNREEIIQSNETIILDSASAIIEEVEAISELTTSVVNEEDLVPLNFLEASEPFSRILTIDNITLDISIYDSYSIIFYPMTIKNDFIVSFIEYVLSLYPSLIESVTYTLNNGEAIFYYPEGFIGDDNWKESVVLEFNKLINDYISIDKENDYTTYSYILNDKDLTILLSNDDVVIENINSFSNDEINSLIELIVSNYPELSQLSYSIVNDKLVLNYPESIDIYSYITMISSLVNDEYTKYEESALNEVIEPSESINKSDDVVLNEETVVISGEIEDLQTVLLEEEVKEALIDSEEKKVEAPIEVVEPLTEKGRNVKKYELAISYSPDLILNKAVFDNHYATLRLFYSLSDNFKLGISTSYNFKNNILLSIIAKYYLNESIYAFVEGGNTFILNEALKPNYFVELGLGYDYKVSESFSLFAELGVKYSFNDYKIAPKVSIGGSILF